MGKNKGPLFTILLLILVIGAISAAAYFYNRYINLEKSALGETESIMETLSGFMELPNENPTIATVTDKSKLENQAFFKNALNGDKLLIFTDASKAILYRPETKKIIEVSNLAVTGDTTLVPNVNSVKEEITLALYNGTGENGLVGQMEKEIFNKTDSFKVVAKKDAKKSNYENTLVIDISGENKEVASALAQSLLGEISSLPSGESKPNADILVIFGKNHP